MYCIPNGKITFIIASGKYTFEYNGELIVGEYANLKET